VSGEEEHGCVIKHQGKLQIRADFDAVRLRAERSNKKSEEKRHRQGPRKKVKKIFMCAG